MNEFFSGLDEKDRMRLRLLGLLLLLAVFVLIFFSLGRRRGYHLLSQRLEVREKAAAAEKLKQDEGDVKWAQWQKAYRDIKDLKDKHFYLQKIFSTAGITSRTYRYSYASLEKEKIRKINVTFTFTGTYPILKRFLQTLEQFPKFLLLEKIDFLKIGGDGAMLELRIVLAAYYANF
jgi:hypothetical protein